MAGKENSVEGQLVKNLGFCVVDNKLEHENIVEVSFSSLIKIHFEKLPIVNANKLNSSHRAQQNEIEDLEEVGEDCLEKTKSKVQSFLDLIPSENNIASLSRDSNTLTVTTTRKLMEIFIKFGLGYKQYQSIPLDAFLEVNEKYGPVLKLRYKTPDDQLISSAQSRQIPSFGRKFESYITDGELKNRKRYGLYSIHCIQFGDVRFVYEAEVDAIQERSLNSWDIVEVKTSLSSKKCKSIMHALTLYGKKSRASTKDLIELDKKENLRLPFIQGELGAVDKFIYGFAGNDQTVKIEELLCKPNKVLSDTIHHLKRVAEVLSFANLKAESTWNNWTECEFKRTRKNYIGFKKGQDILGEVSAGSNVLHGLTSKVNKKCVH